MKSPEELVVDYKKAIEQVISSDNGCIKIKLDSRLAILVGWMKSEGPNPILRKSDSTYCLTTGIGVSTSAESDAEMELFSKPTFKNDSRDLIAWDTYCPLPADYSEEYLKNDIQWFLAEYRELSRYIIEKDGFMSGHKLMETIANEISKISPEEDESIFDNLESKIQKEELWEEEQEKLLKSLDVAHVKWERKQPKEIDYDRRAVEQDYDLEKYMLDGMSIEDAEQFLKVKSGKLSKYILK